MTAPLTFQLLVAVFAAAALWPDPRTTKAGVARAALAGCAVAVAAATAWTGTFLDTLLGAAAFATVVRPRWADGLRQATTIAAIGALPPTTTLAAAVATGTTSAWSTGILVGVPLGWGLHAVSVALVAIAAGLFVRAARDGGTRSGDGRARAVAIGATAFLGALVVARVAYVTSVARMPAETYWSEAPFLVNALKLDAHLPLYGGPEALNSYTYSPLLNLLHHAVLSPLRLELSLQANRVLSVTCELAAAAVAMACVGARDAARCGWPVLLLVLGAFGSLLAATVHPDHAVLLCEALACAAALAEPASRRGHAARGIALLLLAPMAASFKLSGAGLGVGLTAAFACERRWRTATPCAVSLVLVLLTLPLFEALHGDYAFYAVRVQASHPVVWQRLTALPTHPVSHLVLLVAAAFVALRIADGAPLLDSRERRVLFITAGIGALSLPGWLKYAGRDNNLVPWVFGAAIMLALRAVRTRRASLSANALTVVAALAGVWSSAQDRPPSRALIARVGRDVDAMTALVRDADARGERVLLPVSVVPWIRAGHRDVPSDRLASAIELFFGGFSQGALFFEHIQDGRYATIVFEAHEFAEAEGEPARAFHAQLVATLARRYREIRPTQAAGDLVVFRRFDLSSP